MIYFTGDTHFGHKNIIEYCGRPFADVETHDRALIDNWNSVVKPGDTVFHLGDFAFRRTFDGHDGSDRDYESLLQGNMILIKGNHDRKHPKSIIESLTVRFDCHRIFCIHDPALANPLMLTLCAHVHEKWKIQHQGFPIVNVGVDQWDFKPVTLEQIMNFIRKEKS